MPPLPFFYKNLRMVRQDCRWKTGEELRTAPMKISPVQAKASDGGLSGGGFRAILIFLKETDMSSARIKYMRDAREVYGGGLAYATPGSAGLDLRACMDAAELSVAPGARVSVPVGVAVEPPDADTAAFVYSRSGLGAVKGLTVAQGVGVIDPDYRGEICVWLLNTSPEPVTVRRGDRVAQLVFQSVRRPEPVAAESLSDTARGAGGFGHTGAL